MRTWKLYYYPNCIFFIFEMVLTLQEKMWSVFLTWDMLSSQPSSSFPPPSPPPPSLPLSPFLVATFLGVWCIKHQLNFTSWINFLLCYLLKNPWHTVSLLWEPDAAFPKDATWYVFLVLLQKRLGKSRDNIYLLWPYHAALSRFSIFTCFCQTLCLPAVLTGYCAWTVSTPGFCCC